MMEHYGYRWSTLLASSIKYSLTKSSGLVAGSWGCGLGFISGYGMCGRMALSGGLDPMQYPQKSGQQSVIVLQGNK